MRIFQLTKYRRAVRDLPHGGGGRERQRTQRQRQRRWLTGETRVRYAGPLPRGQRVDGTGAGAAHRPTWRHELLSLRVRRRGLPVRDPADGHGVRVGARVRHPLCHRPQPREPRERAAGRGARALHGCRDGLRGRGEARPQERPGIGRSRARPVPEMVPIEHETAERESCGRSSSSAPPAALAVGGMAGVGRSPPLARPGRARESSTPSPGWASPSAITGSSPTAASGPSRPVRALLAVLGSMAVEGPLHRVGVHPSKAPQLLRPTRRPAQPPHGRCARDGAARCAGSGTRMWAGCSAARTWRTPSRYAKDLLADRDLRFISRTFPLWVMVGLALPFALGWR